MSSPVTKYTTAQAKPPSGVADVIVGCSFTVQPDLLYPANPGKRSHSVW